MSKYIGRLINLGLARESTRGTAVAATHWLPKANVSFFDRGPRHLSKLNYGVIGEGNLAPKIMEHAEGTIEGDIVDRAFGLLLYSCFGTLVTSGPVDSAYTHTFSLQNDNQHDSLTITIADPDRSDQYALAMLDSLEITVVPDDVVTFVATYKSRTGRQIAAATATYVATNKFLGRHTTVKLAALTGGLAAASGLSLKKFTMKFSKNAVLNNVLSTVWPDDILNTKFEITGTLDLDLEDQTYRALMLDGSYRALRLNLNNQDVLIGATSTPQFTIDLSRVFLDEWEAARPNDDIVTQKINYRALYDITNANIINSCTLINNVTSY